ncbi:hypothetical protein BBW65_02515 [Helicobacter enhydrae]|uniref:Uncharacterized protein n=1 Tax=Helicobacter enhydrae TaxID=222136 RepID=A0A1B1U4R5_9HELI|nr:hypothetical protein BBW65_02515 [Helicobacter enhydrae]
MVYAKQLEKRIQAKLEKLGNVFFQSKHQKDRIRKILELPKNIAPPQLPQENNQANLKQDSNQVCKLKKCAFVKVGIN